MCLENFYASLCAQKPTYYYWYTTCTSSTRRRIAEAAAAATLILTRAAPLNIYLVSALPCSPRLCVCICIYLYKYMYTYMYEFYVLVRTLKFPRVWSPALLLPANLLLDCVCVRVYSYSPPGALTLMTYSSSWTPGGRRVIQLWVR